MKMWYEEYHDIRGLARTAPVTMIKVDSHKEDEEGISDKERYKRWLNGLADRAAKDAAEGSQQDNPTKTMELNGEQVYPLIPPHELINELGDKDAIETYIPGSAFPQYKALRTKLEQTAQKKSLQTWRKGNGASFTTFTHVEDAMNRGTYDGKPASPWNTSWIFALRITNRALPTRSLMYRTNAEKTKCMECGETHDTAHLVGLQDARNITKSTEAHQDIYTEHTNNDWLGYQEQPLANMWAPLTETAIPGTPTEIEEVMENIQTFISNTNAKATYKVHNTRGTFLLDIYTESRKHTISTTPHALHHLMQRHKHTAPQKVLDMIITNMLHQTHRLKKQPRPRTHQTLEDNEEGEMGTEQKSATRAGPLTLPELMKPFHYTGHLEWKLLDNFLCHIVETFDLDMEMFSSSYSYSNTSLSNGYTFLEGDSAIDAAAGRHGDAQETTTRWSSRTKAGWCNPGFTHDAANPNNTITKCIHRAVQECREAPPNKAVRFVILAPQDHADAAGQRQIERCIAHYATHITNIGFLHTPPDTILYLDTLSMFFPRKAATHTAKIGNTDEFSLPSHCLQPLAPALKLLLVENKIATRTKPWNPGQLRYRLESAMIAVNPNRDPKTTRCEIINTHLPGTIPTREYRQTRTNWNHCSWTVLPTSITEDLNNNRMSQLLKFRMVEANTAARLGTMGLDPGRTHNNDSKTIPPLKRPQHKGPYTAPSTHSIETDALFCRGYTTNIPRGDGAAEEGNLSTRGLALRNPIACLGFAQGQLATAVVQHSNRIIHHTLKSTWKRTAANMKSWEEEAPD